MHVHVRRALHTPIDRFPGSIAVVELSHSPHFTAKFAIPGQGKDRKYLPFLLPTFTTAANSRTLGSSPFSNTSCADWDKAEIEVRGTTSTKEAIVPPWMNFLHGEVCVTTDAKAETLSKHLAEEFQQRLLELQQRTPKVYETFWRENGERILEGTPQKAP